MEKKKGWTIIIVLAALACTAAALGSCASGIELMDPRGERIALEVDGMERIKLNGTRQWIYLAGAEKDNPILLWLDGGPGGSELGTVRHYLGDLHKSFTVVCWDQRGTGKSRRTSASLAPAKVEKYVEDVLELSRLLIKRFGTEKIYLVGHSWGSIIGAMAAASAPELYHAYVGVGQQVNSGENDRVGWEMVRRGAEAAGHSEVVRRLDKMGQPPYSKGGDYFYLFSRLYRYSPHPPGNSHFDSTWFFKASQHSFFDRIAVGIGLLDGVMRVYPQLADLDFERDLRKIDCPVFIVAGKYDLTCVSSIAKRWFDSLEAPEKEFVWFENAGHNACYEEPERFVALLRSLAENR
jgi:pimeloyl-ACP methyl ester carboxylesterase